MTYQHHDCDERGCHPGHRASHARTQERHRRSTMGKIIRAGRPAPSIRTLPTTSPLPPQGPRFSGSWVDEFPSYAEMRELTRSVMEKVDARLVGVLPPVIKNAKPFDFKEHERWRTEQFPESDQARRLTTEAIAEWNREALAKWEQMLAVLSAPPEGKAWFPVMEIDDDQLDLTRNRNTIVYRIRPELRDA